MLGDTAVAVHPDDERYRDLIGKHAILPLVGRRIPIVADEYSDPEKGTGAVKITPAHDFNDFEVGRRHHLPLINMLDVEAKLDLRDNAAFLDGRAGLAELIETLDLHGLDRFAARKRIVERLEEAGLLDKIEPHTHMVPHGDRGNVPIEPFLTDQWYVDAKELAAMAIAAVNDRPHRIRAAELGEDLFRLDGEHPALVHLAPALVGPPDPGLVRAGRQGVRRRERGRGAGRGARLLRRQRRADARKRPTRSPTSADRRATFLKRDEDVLDTWFSSALWPFSTLGWPDETPELKRYYPTNALVTGFDIIFFWVARMMMMGLHFMKEVPFDTVYIHALVRDERGAKMSKSKGNVIDPLDLIDDYGADALRFTLAAMAAQGRDIKLSTQRVEGYRNFATKLWNAARFAEMNERRDGAGLRSAARDRDAEQLDRARARQGGARDHRGDRGLPVQRGGGRGLSLRLERLLRLVSRAGEAGAHGPGRRRPRPRRAPWWPGCATRSSSCCIRSCRSSPRSCGRVTATAPRATLLALDAWPAHEGLDNPQAEAEIGWVVDLVSAIRSVRAEMNIAARDAARCWSTRRTRRGRARALGRLPQAPRARVRDLLRRRRRRRAPCSWSCAARSRRCRSRA